MRRIIGGVFLASLHLSASGCNTGSAPAENVVVRALTAEEAAFEATIKQETAEASVGADRVLLAETREGLEITWEEFAARIDKVNEKIEQTLIKLETSNHNLDWRPSVSTYLQDLQTLLSLLRSRWRAKITPYPLCESYCRTASHDFWRHLKQFLGDLSAIKPKLQGFRLVDDPVLVAAVRRNDEEANALRKSDQAASSGPPSQSLLSNAPSAISVPDPMAAARAAARDAAREAAKEQPGGTNFLRSIVRRYDPVSSERAKETIQERARTQSPGTDWRIRRPPETPRPLGNEEVSEAPMVLEGVRRRPTAAPAPR